MTRLTGLPDFSKMEDTNTGPMGNDVKSLSLEQLTKQIEIAEHANNGETFAQLWIPILAYLEKLLMAVTRRVASGETEGFRQLRDEMRYVDCFIARNKTDSNMITLTVLQSIARQTYCWTEAIYTVLETSEEIDADKKFVNSISNDIVMEMMSLVLLTYANEEKGIDIGFLTTKVLADCRVFGAQETDDSITAKVKKYLYNGFKHYPHGDGYVYSFTRYYETGDVNDRGEKLCTSRVYHKLNDRGRDLILRYWRDRQKEDENRS